MCDSYRDWTWSSIEPMLKATTAYLTKADASMLCSLAPAMGSSLIDIALVFTSWKAYAVDDTLPIMVPIACGLHPTGSQGTYLITSETGTARVMGDYFARPSSYDIGTLTVRAMTYTVSDIEGKELHFEFDPRTHVPNYHRGNNGSVALSEDPEGILGLLWRHASQQCRATFAGVTGTTI